MIYEGGQRPMRVCGSLGFGDLYHAAELHVSYVKKEERRARPLYEGSRGVT